MAAIPKPQYGGQRRPTVPAESTASERVTNVSLLLGLQTAAASDPGSAADNSLATLRAWLIKTGQALRRTWHWWRAADFRTRQLPLLALALCVWSVTAWMAWRSEESATPLLRERLAQQLAASPAPASSPAHAPYLPRATASPGVFAHFVGSWERLWTPAPSAAGSVAGNPQIRVWVDLKTGLYYCPGEPYYGMGGRRRGKYASQKSAELDYFQPASGAPCP